VKRILSILLVSFGLPLLGASAFIFVSFHDLIDRPVDIAAETAEICAELTTDPTKESDRFHRCWDQKMRATGGAPLFLIFAAIIGTVGVTLSWLGVSTFPHRKPKHIAAENLEP
jgi:hypothetical protein